LKISIVIPCFNHGIFLNEAISSVKEYNGENFEIIVVDDGSTEKDTIEKISELKQQDIIVIEQQNKGLASARNIGVKNAKGKYILLLDADNKIKAEYIQKSIEILESEKCDIVYGKPIFFGEVSESRIFNTSSFNGTNLLKGNYIDACAIFRKSVWSKVGGFDENMPFQGHEDWEFWINCFLSGFQFSFVNEELYYYRVRSDSMITEIDRVRQESNHNFILVKHKNRILTHLSEAASFKSLYENDQKKPLRSSVKYFIYFLKKYFKFQIKK
jgi:glycosyltransferase involved in cell wall biosynthesis